MHCRRRRRRTCWRKVSQSVARLTRLVTATDRPLATVRYLVYRDVTVVWVRYLVYRDITVVWVRYLVYRDVTVVWVRYLVYRDVTVVWVRYLVYRDITVVWVPLLLQNYNHFAHEMHFSKWTSNIKLRLGLRNNRLRLFCLLICIRSTKL